MSLDLAAMLEWELSRFRILPAVEAFRKFVTVSWEEVRLCPYSSVDVRVTMFARINDRVFIGYRHTADRAKWGLFFFDSEEPKTLGTENYWYLSLEDAFYNCPGWNGELPEDYVIE